MRYIIINADDFGLTSEINRGIIDCFIAGAITNASIIINERGSEEGARLAKETGLPLGLHLNLFAQTFGEHHFFGQESRLRRILRDREEEKNMHTHLNEGELRLVKDEFNNQIEMFGDRTNNRPNHLSYHLGLHFIPEIFSILVELAETHGIPFRWGKQYGPEPRYAKHPDKLIDRFNGPGLTSHDFLSALDEAEKGVNEICVHPGYTTPCFSDSYNEERENELRILLSSVVRSSVGEAGILTDYSILLT